MNSKSVPRIIQKMLSFRVYLFFLTLLLFICNGSLQAQWVQVNVPFAGGADCLTPIGTNLFAAQWGSGVYLSTNNGNSWAAANTGLTDKSLYVNCLAVNGKNLYAGTEGNGSFLTTNNGASWTNVNLELDYSNGIYIYSIALSGSNYYFGFDGGIDLSTDNGNHWSIIVISSTRIGQVNSIIVSGTKTYFGTDNGVYLSTNNGFNWTNIGLNNNAIITLFVKDSCIYAGTFSNGVFLSTNDGSTWTALNTGLPGNTIHNFAAYELSLFVGTNNGIYRLDNSGSNWTPVKSGLTDTLVYSLAVCGTNLFAGTSRGLWKRPLSELVGITDKTNEVPNEFILHQNFPNPFNPNTVIIYSLSSTSNIKLIIYNTLGQTIKILENGFKHAGNYSINFNASDLPSGIYFYKLEAEQFSQVKKMILIK